MPVIFKKKCPYFTCLGNNIGNKIIRLGTNKTRWMSQKTNSTVYLLAQKQRRGRRAALVTGCQVNDSLHQWILREVSCLYWLSISEKENSKRGEALQKPKKYRETQTGGTEKKTKTHQTRMPRTLPLILSWTKRCRRSLSVTQKKNLHLCVSYLLCRFLAPGREEEKHFRRKHSLLILPPCVYFCNPCKCS